MENEKNIIRREAGKILRAHFAGSIALLILLGMVLFVWMQYERPGGRQCHAMLRTDRGQLPENRRGPPTY